MHGNTIENTLLWASWDSSHEISAALHGMLSRLAERQSITGQGIASGWLGAFDLPGLRRIARRRELGLVLWVLQEPDHLREICISIREFAELERPPARICFVAPKTASQAVILMEAGAQIVAAQLTSLHAALPRLCDGIQQCSQDSHPLTIGLADRLPWGEYVEPARKSGRLPLR